MKRWILERGLIPAALVSLIFAAGLFFALQAIAQVPTLFIASPTGNEQIAVIEPSTGTVVTNPQIQVITLNQARNATGYLLVPTGTTVSTTVPLAASRVLATGAITTWNVTLPTVPYDGEFVLVGCPGGTVTTLSIAATLPTGVSLVGTSMTSCTSGGAGATANTGAEYVYSVSANTWYRIQ